MVVIGCHCCWFLFILLVVYIGRAFIGCHWFTSYRCVVVIVVIVVIVDVVVIVVIVVIVVLLLL